MQSIEDDGGEVCDARDEKQVEDRHFLLFHAGVALVELSAVRENQQHWQ